MRDNQQSVSRIANPFITRRLGLPEAKEPEAPGIGPATGAGAVPRMGPAVARLVSIATVFVLALGLISTTLYLDRLNNRGVATGPDLTPISFTGDNPVGANTFLEKEADGANVDRSLQLLADGHFKWLRQAFPWYDIEIHGKGDFVDRRHAEPVSAWDKYDHIVDKAESLGLQIMARIDAPPNWARPAGVDLGKHGPPANYQDFADFVATIVSRYKGRVTYFQIWNEPNLEGEWAGRADAKGYAELLKLSYEAAKRANPDAVIVMSSLAQTNDRLDAPDSAGNETELRYLQEMYDAGAKPYFDIASVMVYGLGYPPDYRATDQRVPGDNERINFSRALLFREVMERNGDSAKPVWASEYAWISVPTGWDGYANNWGDSVDEQTQAQYLVDGYKRAQAEWPWMGPMFIWHLREPDDASQQPQRWFAIVNNDFSPRPAYTALSNYAAQFPMAGTGAYPANSPALTKGAAGDTIRFSGTGLDLVLDPHRGVLNVEGSIDGQPPSGWRTEGAAAGAGILTVPTSKETSDKWKPLPDWPNSPDGIPYRLRIAEELAPGAHTFSFTLLGGGAAVNSSSDGLQGYVVSHQPDAPWRYPLSYVLMGLTIVWSAGRFTLGLVRLPRILSTNIRRPGLAGDRAAGTIAASGMAVALVAYYFLPMEWLALFALLVWFALAVWRPSTALVITAVVFPFYWVPRYLAVPFMLAGGASGVANLPLSETCLWLTLAAWLLHRTLRPFFARPARGATDPGVTSYLRIFQELQGPASPQQRFSAWVGRRLRRQPAEPEGDAGVTGYLDLYQELQGPATPLQRLQAWALRDPFGACAVLLLAVGTISLLTVASSDYLKDSLRAYRWVIVEPVLFYFLATDIMRGRRRALRLLDGFAVGAVVAAVLAIVGGALHLGVVEVEGVSRIQGVFSQPNNLALYMGRAITLVGVTGFLLTAPNERIRRRLYLLASAVMLVALVLTFSRGAYLAVGISFAVILLLANRRLGLILGGLGLAGIGAGIVAAAAGILPERLLNAGSSLIRLDLWGSTLAMLRDHPIFGVGLDQFLNQYQDFYICDTCGGERWLSHPHNLVFDWWLSLGIIGMLVGGLIIYRYGRAALALSRRSDPIVRAVAFGALAMLVDFVVHGLVDNSYFLQDLALTFWLALALLQLMRRSV